MFSPVDEAKREEEVFLGVTEPNNLCKAVEEIVEQEPLNKNHVMSNGVDSLPLKYMITISQYMPFLYACFKIHLLLSQVGYLD